MTPLRPTIRLLRCSGWPATAIAHLLRSNHPEWSPRWLRTQISQQISQDKRKARL